MGREDGILRPRQPRVWVSSSSRFMVRKSEHIEQRRMMGLSGCIFRTCLLTLWLLGPSSTLSQPG